MAKKKVKAIVKIQMEAGKATPAPPVGTALGPHGVNIMEFVKTYNDRTASMAGQVIPVEITIFKDRSLTFVTKAPPAAALMKNAAGAAKGSAQPNQQQVGRGTQAPVRDTRPPKHERRTASGEHRGRRARPLHATGRTRLEQLAGRREVCCFGRSMGFPLSPDMLKQ